MAKKYNVKADEVEGLPYGFVIRWSGNIGFGEYTVHQAANGSWIGESECMDRGEDKSFLEHLFSSIVEQIEICS